MTRVYTVKSNARRDARKLGIDPDLVKPTKGGFYIDFPAPAAEKKPKRGKAKLAAKPAHAPAGADPKRDRLVSMLADWTPTGDLMASLGWQAHTVRGAISTAAKARGIVIERRRVDGVTSYRIKE